MLKLEKRICRYCGVEFETTNPRKLFCNKQHADRSRNGVYTQPEVVTWESIKDLRHFSKLDDEGKRKVLLGEAGFSVLFYDLECTHLKPNIGRIICCSFKNIRSGEIWTVGALDKGHRKPDTYDDSYLARTIRNTLEEYDIIVGHNSLLFDTKFLNARLLRAGLNAKEAQYQVDTMWKWRSKSSAWSGLAAIQQFVDNDGPQKTTIDWRQWMRVLGWSKKLRDEAMAEIQYHCERDVEVLERMYRFMVEHGLVRNIKKDGGLVA